MAELSLIEHFTHLWYITNRSIFPILTGGFYPDSVACLVSFFEEAMDRRQFPNSFRMVIDQGLDRNHLTAEQSYIHMGTESSHFPLNVLLKTSTLLTGTPAGMVILPSC